MSAALALSLTQSPWHGNAADERRFRLIAGICLGLALLIGATLNIIHAPKPERRQVEAVPPHLARVIMEQRKQVEPPPPKPIETPKQDTPEKALKPTREEVKKPEPKPETHIETKPEPKPQPPVPTPAQAAAPTAPTAADRAAAIEAARAKARSTGLLAMQDELAELRNAAPTETIKPNQPLQAGAQTARVINNPSALMARATTSSAAASASVGNFQRDTAGKALAGRSTTTVTSKPELAAADTPADTKKRGGPSGRSESEIQRVFDANKASIFTLYRMALRNNPALQGKVVLRLTIDPGGRVTECSIVSSELNDATLEGKLVSRVKMFDFGAKDVETTTVTYPIDFVPNF